MNPFEEDELQERAYDATLMRRFLGYLRPHVGLVLLCPLILLVWIAADLAGPFLLRHAVDGPVMQKDLAGLWRIAGLFLLVTIANAGLEFTYHYLSNLAGQRILYDLRTGLFRHLQNLSISFYNRNPIGRLLVRVTNDVENLNELFTSGLSDFIGDVLQIAAILVAMFLLNTPMTLLTLATLPVIILASLLFRRYAREAYRQGRRAIARLNSYLGESVGGARTIQIFNREETCFQRFEERNREYRDRSLRSIYVYSLFWPGVEFISAAALAGLLAYASGQIHSGALTFGTFIAFFQLLQKFFHPVRELAEKYNILQAAMASAERIFQIFDTPVEVTVPTLPVSPPRRGEIEFNRVSFSYDGKTPVLHDVSFRIRPGERVAIVGHTGAGKTTLLNLLLRLHDTTSGEVRVDGANVREYDPRELRRRFGLVLQDVFLFAGTVEENLRLSEPMSRERIEQAVRTVHAESLVARLPQGYDTPLRERGLSLSAGERQLLSLARAVAFDPPVLVLDEATSSVDSETEALLQKGIERLMKGRTSLIVAHRLSTIREADRILVLHHGRLQEEGTHAELLQRGGVYEKLWRLQELPAAG